MIMHSLRLANLEAAHTSHTSNVFIKLGQRYGRIFTFLLVIIIHILILCSVKFSTKSVPLVEESFDVLKLVDIEEYLPPPPPAPKPIVQEKIQQVVNQVKASEEIEETDKIVEEVAEDIPVIMETEPVYLPQHKISVIPEIPAEKILSNIVYPPMALKQGIQGVVYLELYIDEVGNIRKIVVIKNPGYGFAEAAVSALDGITCKPALANDKPVAVRFRYPVRFTLK